MKLLQFFVVFLALAARPASAQNPEAAGKDLGEALGHSTARIEFSAPDGSKQPGCTGVLVRPRVLLTAAHCWGSEAAPSRQATSVSFRAGAGKAGESRRLDGYAGQEASDLALVNFDVAGLKGVKPAAVVDDLSAIKKGAFLVVGSGGVGASAEAAPASQARLRVVSVDPQKGLAYAAPEKGESCWTDGGSPAFLLSGKGARLAGVVSRPQSADCKPEDPVVVTLLAPHKDWLEKNEAGLADGRTSGGGSTWGKGGK